MPNGNDNSAMDALKILIVEDTPVQALRFKSLLESNGCNVYWADTGRSGLAIAQQETFDLFILDIELPDTNGFEVCRQLKSNPALKDTPVIMLTTHDQAEDVSQGLDLGATDYIPKDMFAEAVLVETIKYMTAEKQM